MSSSSRHRRAIVIGGSMSGLFAAAFLRQIGWDADVYERSAVELVGRGAGITTHPELLQALKTAGPPSPNPRRGGRRTSAPPPPATPSASRSSAASRWIVPAA